MVFSRTFLLLILLLVLQASTTNGGRRPESHKHSSSHHHDSSSSSSKQQNNLRLSNLQETFPAYASFPGRMYAGSLPMDHPTNSDTSTKGKYQHHKQPQPQRTGFLQFWLFVPDQTAAPGTMVSWFNGGPGCSSFSAGVLMQHSPVTVPPRPAGFCCAANDEPLQANPYAWTNATVMLYVEQPIGVGFSEATHGTPPSASEEDVAMDFDAFLQKIYKIFNGYEEEEYSSQSVYDPSLDMGSHKLYLVG